MNTVCMVNGIFSPVNMCALFKKILLQNYIMFSLVATFVKLCYRLRQAGHMEKAVSLFQALLEYNLFCPGSLSTERRLDFFTAYWESDVPRVGEEGAQGWAEWVANQGRGPAYVPNTSKR